MHSKRVSLSLSLLLPTPNSCCPSRRELKLLLRCHQWRMPVQSNCQYPFPTTPDLHGPVHDCRYIHASQNDSRIGRHYPQTPTSIVPGLISKETAPHASHAVFRLLPFRPAPSSAQRLRGRKTPQALWRMPLAPLLEWKAGNHSRPRIVTPSGSAQPEAVLLPVQCKQVSGQARLMSSSPLHSENLCKIYRRRICWHT